MNVKAASRPYRMDARAAAAEATRERILDIAYGQFMERWYDEVTLRDTAKEAGVALQTVVNHFGTKENLFSAVTERFSASIAETRGGVLPDDIAGAAAALVADYEQTGDTNLRMLALEERVPAVAEGLAAGRRSHREWVERIFPTALSNLRGAHRRRCLAELLTITDVLTWKMLRRDHGLSRSQTADAIRDLLEAVHDHHKES
jgi:AcrR family transcriptional regulator